MKATQFLREMRPPDVPIHLWVESLYNAWAARPSDQQAIKELLRACKAARAALVELSYHTAFEGDAPEFNAGGIGYETGRTLDAALAHATGQK